MGSRNKSGSGPSLSEALFGVVASDDGSVWVKLGSGAITCGLEAGKLGISSQSSSKSDSESSSWILSTLVGLAVRFRSFGTCMKKLLILANPAAALHKVASFLYRVAWLVLV